MPGLQGWVPGEVLLRYGSKLRETGNRCDERQDVLRLGFETMLVRLKTRSIGVSGASEIQTSRQSLCCTHTLQLRCLLNNLRVIVHSTNDAIPVYGEN